MIIMIKDPRLAFLSPGWDPEVWVVSGQTGDTHEMAEQVPGAQGRVAYNNLSECEEPHCSGEAHDVM